MPYISLELLLVTISIPSQFSSLLSTDNDNSETRTARQLRLVSWKLINGVMTVYNHQMAVQGEAMCAPCAFL